jgi:hypothetical protein
MDARTPRRRLTSDEVGFVLTDRLLILILNSLPGNARGPGTPPQAQLDDGLSGRRPAQGTHVGASESRSRGARAGGACQMGVNVRAHGRARSFV